MTEYPTQKNTDPGNDRKVRRAQILAELHGALARRTRQRRRQRVGGGLAVIACACGLIFWVATGHQATTDAQNNLADLASPEIPAQPDLLPVELPNANHPVSAVSKSIVHTNPDLLKDVLVTNRDMANRSVVESVSDDELAELLAANASPFIVARIDQRLVAVQVGSKSSSRSD